MSCGFRTAGQRAEPAPRRKIASRYPPLRYYTRLENPRVNRRVDEGREKKREKNIKKKKQPESRDVSKPVRPELVTRHADATGRLEYRLAPGLLAIIIFDRQLLLRERWSESTAVEQWPGDDYNFSVSITVAARLPAIFQWSKVRPVSIIIAQHVIDRVFLYQGRSFREKRKDRSRKRFSTGRPESITQI